ncbi:ABC transporter substrate-binding protein [Glycomyces terrestris]|uniref:ABC transporter substrate-binding protein n=1 Tax=Glycomyces terrestris TaxID=2493553 RepID=A0A426V2X2_9ACTN|nr:ABC transporter substrate-binding protein [Glycomyces terrestris]RRS01254.1 ABC transporter substrate-binding protein [Glycomyces terrestris]
MSATKLAPATRNVPDPSPPSNRNRSRRIRAALAASALAVAAGLAACGRTDPNAFTVALVEPDLTTVPLLAAVDAVREQGYDVDVVELAEPELAIEGLARGDYAFSAEATSPALLAIEQDAPIRIVADVIGNQWAVYGRPGVDECDDLADRPVGIFSEGAVATAMVRDWVADECTAGEPEYLVIGGSDVRAQALLAGQIDATALEVADAVALAAAGETELEPLVDFGAALPDLHPQTVYANTGFLADAPEAADAFIDALVAVHERINADPGHLVDLAVEYLGEEPGPVLDAIAQAYVDEGLFDAAALTEENVQGTIDFFTEAGVIGELSADDVADLSFLG